MGKPGFFFYTGDWIKDTSCLALEAQGAWMRALCLLYEHGGEVTWPVFSFAQFWGVSNDNALCILTQLELTRVANVEWQNSGKTVAKLSNRRMVRDVQKREQLREVRREAGRRGAWQKWHSSSSSSLNIKEKYKNTSHSAHKKPVVKITRPEKIDAPLWDEFVAHRKRKRAPLTVEIVRRLCSRLEQLENLGHEPNSVIRQIIDRNWVFVEIEWIHKNGAQQNGKRSHNEPRGYEAIHEVMGED